MAGAAAALTGLVDSHCHLTSDAFDGDRAEVLARARAAGVEDLVLIGLDPESSERALDLAAGEPGLYATAGLHPHEAGRFDAAVRAALEELCGRPDCFGVGESGLDWFKEWAPRAQQLASFRWHLELARDLDKPVVIHSRDAHEDTLELVRQVAGVRGVMHCYSYGAAELGPYLEAGLFVSFSGNVTFPRSEGIRAAARACPPDRLLVETDAPFLAPVPHRGQRCEPAHCAQTLRFVAEVRGEDATELARRAGDNARNLFGLPGA